MTKLPGFYTITEAATALGLARSGAAWVAKQEGWKPIRIGNVHLYHKADVLEYRDHRQRTELVRALGWRSHRPGQGLYRADDIDITCPVCGAFAVAWPPPPEIQIKFKCLEGHEGEL